METAIRKRVEHAISEYVFPGCVVGILRSSEDIVLPFGTFAYDGDPVQAHTVYDLASVTKSIPLAPLIAVLAHDRNLSIDDPISTYVPELQNDYGATIEDLLRYRVTGLRMSALADRSADEIETAIYGYGFDGPPGESRYSNLPAYLLGIIVERVTGESLPALAGQYFFDPFLMRNTRFNAGECISSAAPSEMDEERKGEIRGWPHDESAYVFARAGRAVGHAGLFSTTPDLLRFLKALLSHEGPFFMETVREGALAGLGWQTTGDFLGSNSNAGRFGKTGFTGTSIACDTARKIALVILSNRTFPRRPADGTVINAFRRDIADLVFA